MVQKAKKSELNFLYKQFLLTIFWLLGEEIDHAKSDFPIEISIKGFLIFLVIDYESNQKWPQT